MNEESHELKHIEREIEEDFERTDREIQEAENYEPQGWEKWDWLLWGLFCSIIGIIILFYLNIYGGAWTFMTWAWFLFGAALLGCGILSFIFRDTIFWLS
ncbi:MAG: hypothetical protein AMK69_28595 [Nitrospira bacterium SG8_3]|nr:MAG: hypothetical protein AMK69_28595 [Nitrospira bacterium SG8_3]